MDGLAVVQTLCAVVAVALVALWFRSNRRRKQLIAHQSDLQPQRKNSLAAQLLGFVVGFGATVGLEMLILAAFQLRPRGIGWVFTPILVGITLARWEPSLLEMVSRWRTQRAQRSLNAQNVSGAAAAASNPLEERLWSAAANEFEGKSRKPGLWAKAYASAEGNEAQAKAKYLTWRVEELLAENAHSSRGG